MKKAISVKRALCAGCGEPLYPDDVFCSYCGRPRRQQQGVFCTQCGVKLPSDSVFCIQCGAPLEQSPSPETSSPRKKLTRRQVVLLSVLLGLLIVLMITGGVLLYLSQSWVSEISLSHSRLEVMCFETAQLTCSIYPEAAADRPITWSSSDESIATVDQNGVITAVHEGVCTVTVKAQWKTASAEITVTKPDIGMVGVSPSDLTLTTGDTFQLEYTVFPNKYAFLKPDWHSDNDKVATVDENGLVTAVGPGSCRIYVGLYGKSDLVNIVVYDRTPEEKELLGQWAATAAYSSENDQYYDVDHRMVSLTFDVDGTGFLRMDGKSTKFEWVFTEKDEEFFYYAVRFEDDVLNVLSYDGTKVQLEINHYDWFFEINDSYLSINQ